MEEMEETLEDQLESWRKGLEAKSVKTLKILNSEASDHDTEECFDEDEDDHGFYWGGEEELEILFRS